jgi:hypothetical protein
VIRSISDLWTNVKLFLWLEVKKWTRFYATDSYLPLFLFIEFSFLSLTFLNLSLYKPLWQANPRGIVIGGLIFVLLGFFVLSIFNSIFPADETGILLPVNPFHFTLADLSVVILSSGRPFSWASVGWFRTIVKSLWYSLLFFSISFAYCVEFSIPLIHVVFVVGILFLSFQSIILSGSFIYTLTEEIIEQRKPRWRESNFRSLETIGKVLTMIIILGGLGFLSQISKIVSLQLDLLIQNLWFLPPFNMIYMIMTLLSKTWPQNEFLPAFIIFLFLIFTINIIFFLILGSVDPLARLYERQELMSNLSTFSLSLPNPLKRLDSITNNWIIPNHRIQEVYSIARKDLLLCWKYRQIMGYISVLILLYGSLTFSLLTGNKVNPLIFLVGLLWSYWITFFLWQKESKSIIKTFNISKKALMVEKWSLSFILVISVGIPILLTQEYFFLIIGLVIYQAIFLLGFIHFSLKGG